MTVRALIIDDDMMFAKLLEKRLKAIVPDVNITMVHSITAGRATAKNAPSGFDLVLLDEHLPDGRGIDLLKEGIFEDLAVLSVSSDPSPEIPGAAVRAGATYFLSKVAVSEPLFKPLVLGILERNLLVRELKKTRDEQAKLETIRTLVATLRHEINNPLGAVLGAAYLLQHQSTVTPEQKQAAELVESSGRRIKHVLDQLCDTMAIAPVQKGHQQVFHIPGDKPWNEQS